MTVAETGASASVSTAVVVKRANVDARLLVVVGGISAGETTALRPSETVLLDASLSLDPNTGSAAELHYSWTCEQLLPTYHDRCPGLNLGRQSRWQNLEGISQVIVAFDTPQTSNRVTVIVSADDGQQSNTASVVVDTLAVENPSIRTLDWVTLPSGGKKKLTAFADLVLSATIGYGSDLTMQWTVLPDVMNLEEFALTKLNSTKKAPSNGSFVEQVVYFKMPGHALHPRTDYTFTLRTLYASGQSTSATIKLSTNGQPLPGSFRVVPESGVEFETAFLLEARHWQDDDLPLLYSFGVVQGGTAENGDTNGDVTLLQVYSEASTGAHMLMAGTVILQCEIVDALDASTTIRREVQVDMVSMRDTDGTTKNDDNGDVGNSTLSGAGSVPPNVRSVVAFVERTLANTSVYTISINPMLAAQVRMSLGSAIAAINAINCSFATSSMCTGLYRSNCRSDTNTCGECLIGYVGQAGAANSLCVSASALGVGSGEQGAVVQALSLIPRQCPGQCQNRGRCVHMPMQVDGYTDEPDPEFSCRVSDVTCEVVCDCYEGWTGASCEYSVDELRVRTDMKTIVIDSYIAAVESFTDNNIVLDTEATVSGLESLAARPQELNEGSRVKLTTLLTTLVVKMAIVEADVDVLKKDVRPTVTTDLLSIVDTMLSVPTATVVVMHDQNNGSVQAEKGNSELIGLALELVKLQISNMVPGEEMSLVITEKMSIMRTDLVENDAVAGMFHFEVPAMPYDQYPVRINITDKRLRDEADMGYNRDNEADATPVAAFPHMLRLAGKYASPQQAYAHNSTAVEHGFNASVLLSDALFFDMAGLSSSDMVCGTGDVAATGRVLNTSTSSKPTLVHFELPFSRIPEAEGTPLSRINNTSRIVKCLSGRPSRTSVVCNGIVHTISCDGTGQAVEKTIDCIQLVSQQVHCQTRIFPDAGSADGTVCRVVRRSASGITCGCDVCAIRRRLAGTVSPSLDNVAVVAMGEFVVSDFMEVNSAFSSVGDTSTYTDARLVVGAFVTCIVLFIVAIIFSEVRISDEKKKENAIAAQQPHQGDGSYVKLLREKSVGGMIIVKDSGDSDGDANDQGGGGNSDDETALWMYVESLFPSVFSTRSSLGRFIDELTSNHILLAALFGDTRFDRLLSAYEFVSICLQGCFTIALVVSLDIGSQAGCIAHLSAEQCMNDPSVYDPSELACTWQIDAQTCNANTDAKGGFLTSVYIVLLTVMLTIPLRIVHSFIFGGVLRAPNAIPNSAASGNERRGSDREFGQNRFLPSSFAASISRIMESSVSVLQNISIPQKVLDLRSRVFSGAKVGTFEHRQHCAPSFGGTPVFEHDDRIFEKLHRDMYEYIRFCRERNMSYSTDRSVSVGRVNDGVKRDANVGFCRAWRMNVLNSATGEACTSVAAVADESISLVWHDMERLKEVLDTLESQASVASNDCWRYDSVSTGAEMCRHLLLDLLGRNTARGKIFEAKSKWHVNTGTMVTPHTKVVVFMMSVLLNLYYVWVMFLYGSEKGLIWQRSFLLFCGCYLFFLVTLEMTVEAVMVGFVIPCQVLTDVRCLQADLCLKLASVSTQQAVLDHAARYHVEDNGCVDVESQTIGRPHDESSNKDAPVLLNASKFLFVSARLATAFPSVPEACLVKVFEGVHPRYGLVVNERDTHAMKATAALKRSASFSMLTRVGLYASTFSLTSLLTWIGTQPVVLQKVLINMPLPLLSSMMAGIVYLTSQASLIFATVVIVLGAICVCVGALFAIRVARRAVADGELADNDHRASIMKQRRKTDDTAVVPNQGAMHKKVSRLMSLRRLSVVLPRFNATGDGTDEIHVRVRRQSAVDPEFHAWDDGSDAKLVGHGLGTVIPADEADVQEARRIREKLDEVDERRRQSMFVRKERQKKRLQLRLQNKITGEIAPLHASDVLAQHMYHPTVVRKAGSILRAGRRAENAHNLAMEKAQQQGSKKLHDRLASRVAHEQEMLASTSESEASDDAYGDIVEGHDEGVRCAEPAHTLTPYRLSDSEASDGDSSQNCDMTVGQEAAGYDNAEDVSGQASGQGTSSLPLVEATVTRQVPRRVSELHNIHIESEMEDTTLAIMENVIRLMTKKDPVTVASAASRWLSKTKTKAGVRSHEKESARISSAKISVLDLFESDLASDEECGQSVLDPDEPQLKRLIFPAAAPVAAAPSVKEKTDGSASTDDFAITSISVKKGRGKLKSGVAFKPAMVKEVITKKKKIEKKKKKKKIKIKSRKRRNESEKGHFTIGGADVIDPVATPRRIKEDLYPHFMFSTSSDDSC